MSSRSITQPNAQTIPLVDLVNQVQRGRVRIPEFQRLFRWQWEDVRRLFDSIVKGYPIGNLLLWQRPAEATHIELGALELDAPAFPEAWWVVDGQQRLISVANTVHARAGATDERFELAFDLRTNEFRRPPQMEDGYIIPLPVLFDLASLVQWFVSDHPEAKDKLPIASEVTKAIREFSVPVYIVEQQDEAVLRDIFNRMNNYGKRLSRAEVFSALHRAQGRRSAEPHSPFADIAELIDHEQGFGRLDDDTVLRAVLARRGGDVTRDIHLEFSSSTAQARDFANETEESAYREGAAAIARAVAFLQEHLHVPHFAFLPYRYLLVVLARFFAHFPEPSVRNRDLLRRWFWRAAILGPDVFGSWTPAMRMLATRIVAGDETGSVQRLLASPIDRALPPPRLTHFRTNKAGSRIILCALWSLGPRSFLNGDPYLQIDLIEELSAGGTLASVVSRVLRREPEGYEHWAANRIFAMDLEPAGGVRELLAMPPIALTAAMREEVLASHALDGQLVAALLRDDPKGFLEGRQQLIQQVSATFLSQMAEEGFEDTPPLDSLDLDDEDHGERDDAVG
ncbi:DUF262 domain-containing protein [Pendulispora albinea]|uniref:DUF262 domain-containing protein n=1 Tax=Pendulispora albinea TaxID=2741071 RepID=A0ABZ2LQQ2_9BACT